MDTMATRNPLPLLKAAIAAGQTMGLDLTLLPRPPQGQKVDADAWVQLTLENKPHALPVLIRREVTKDTLGTVIHQMAQWGQKGILAVGRVTPPMADALRASGVPFLDGAGNAFLDHPPLFVWVKGERKGKERETNDTIGRAFQPRGLQVLFALLCRPDLVARPYREIADHADVAHGTVGWVMAELPLLGFVTTLNGHRRLIQVERLLSQWVEAYARTLRPKTILGRYRAENLEWTATADVQPFGLLLGGEPAAARLTNFLKPGTATFFGQQVDPRFLATHRLRKDAQGNVEFRRRFWNFECEEPGLVPTILVYADLLAIGDGRCLETAALLLDRIHARFVRPA